MNNNFFKVIFVDDDIVAVSKEHGVCVIPDRYGNEKVILHKLLQEIYGKLYIIHRLDMGTGGIILFARNEKAHKNLSLQFQNNIVTKKYLAITKGTFFPQSLMLPIAKGNHGKYKINFKSGKKAITSFNVIDNKNNFSLIDAKLYTGRTHQIRVHLKALKSPLYQDFLYNSPCNDKRLSLFAYKTIFFHPVTNKKIVLTAEISLFMQGILETLELSLKNVYQI